MPSTQARQLTPEAKGGRKNNMFLRSRLLLLTILFSLTLPAALAYASDYTVAAGDSLFLISQRYGTTVEAIKSVNQLKGDLIYPGQKLTIPDRYYTVQPGDSLYLIGQRFNLSYQEILRANSMSSTVIYPGQVLRIPARENVSRGTVDRGSTPYNARDLDLLARLITAEADSESYLTKVAVGAVVLNRVKSPLFPNSIAEVIYQVDETGRYQFEPVLNGWINVHASPDSIRAAKEALNGADPTKGALYFFESWVPNKFLRSRPVSMVSDSFTFAY
ncbi:cell wall hydrolase SleB [Desulfotomaculum nigrificans CO-1-SRB]|uniref:Cell wall hydrolase SleB n=2 Tax=Desulfotomaculum nigrificans TaxID=1565 RepID=F6B460_DESCC|nr:cell wall hydrolase SleB [Desulfotomaculum nigrificans CO-1-SRB]